MINYIITEHETGFGEEYFKAHPSSHKKVYRVCKKCGQVRWVIFRNVTKLCRSCSLKNRKLSKEHKQNISESCKIKNI